jgi:hypothetical protein
MICRIKTNLSGMLLAGPEGEHICLKLKAGQMKETITFAARIK